MADELRHAPMREDFIRGSDMVSLMQGKWEELWKIKMGLLGRKDLRHEFNVRLGSFTIFSIELFVLVYFLYISRVVWWSSFFFFFQLLFTSDGDRVRSAGTSYPGLYSQRE